MPNASAESATHFDALNRAFSAHLDLIKSWGDAPGCFDTARLALKQLFSGGKAHLRQAGFLLVERYSSERAPALQFCVPVSWPRRRFLSQGVNDKADDCDTDAGVGEVEGRPRIGKANM